MAESAFERFGGESLPALMQRAYALTGNVHAGEDLVQDTLVRMATVGGGSTRTATRSRTPGPSCSARI
jgi:DNA-directed RNA polymerase specialized sigma24 family protein